MEKFIAYYRVSTKKQGNTGLGLKAQREQVNRFIESDHLLMEFTEIETGTNKKHRPILDEALKQCIKHNATLIIAKLDRLARNVSFISSLMDSKVKFKAVDMPEANELTIHIMSAIAQNEAKVISKRIKDALAQSDKQLGTPANLTKEGREKGLKVIREKSINNKNNMQSIAYLKAIDKTKLSLRDIAKQLNENGFLTSRGKEHSAKSVQRLLTKID